MSSRSASSVPRFFAFSSDRRSAFSLGSFSPGCAEAWREGVEDLVVGHLDALCLHHRGQHRLAAQRALGVGLGLGDQLLLGLVGDLEVLLGVEALLLEAAGGDVPHLVRLGVHELVGDVDLGLGRDGIDGRLAVLALDRVLVRWRSRVRDVLAQLVERVVAAGLDGEVVVELGQPLLLDLLDRRP